jgi:hypothetical protein
MSHDAALEATSPQTVWLNHAPIQALWVLKALGHQCAIPGRIYPQLPLTETGVGESLADTSPRNTGAGRSQLCRAVTSRARLRERLPA